MAQNARTTIIASNIRSVTTVLPLVHAKRNSGVMIDPQSQHTQGVRPMKAGNNRRRARFGRARLTTLALLLPLALGSTAQTPLRWNPTPPATPVNAGSTAPVPPAAPSFSTARQIAYAAPPRVTAPLAAGFD